jgi:hypothetical protein
MTDIPVKIGIILLVLSVLFWVLGIYFAIGAADFQDRAVKTTGTVVELAESESDGDVLYKPVVSFSDQQGGEHRFTSSFASRPPRYRVGEQVDVLYDPDDPSDASLGAAPMVWAGPIVLLGLAFFLTITGVLLVTVVKNMIRKKRDRLHDQQELDDPNLLSPGGPTA